jgi:tripartite-type tricarboxylate transporter receptor subunit TctC
METRRRSIGTIAACAIAGLGGLVWSGAAMAADPVEDFYRGRNMDFIIGYSPGGGYDTYARVAAKHLSRFIPGKPNIIPRNMAGAGSLVAASYVFNIAAKDGSVLATVDQSLSLMQAMGDPAVKFDAGKFTYIGNPIIDNNTVATWHASGIKTVDDAKKQEVPMGATGSIGTSTQYVLAMNEMIGTKFKPITGYPGGNDVSLAMEKGEVMGRGSNAWTSWKATRPEWVKDHKINILVQVGLRKVSDLPDVPLLMDLATNPDDKAALKLLSAPTAVGRPIFSTPGVPADRVKALRAAFDQMIRDPQFREDAQKGGLDLDPISGEELQAVVADILATPKPIAERLLKAVGGLAKN